MTVGGPLRNRNGRLLRVLLVHNRYRQAGGEDEVLRNEGELLRAAGHQVAHYVRSNDEIALSGVVSRARLAVHTVWARESHDALREVLCRERPDIAHFHNTFPLISPAAYYACRDAAVAVVQTLHNYRLVCPAATFLRHGEVCEACLGRKVPWPGVAYRCYRHSRGATAAVAAMVAFHRWRNTWLDRVDRYIALTEFSRRKFVQGGLPADRIAVKPNFVRPDPGPRVGGGDYAVFIGRLSPEKGVRTLVEAWKRLGGGVPLAIAGDGPERGGMEAVARGLSNVRFLGGVQHASAVELLKGARFLVFPSEWYEGFPLAIAEALACGVPVVASRLGAMAEIVEDGRTGLHFTAGEPDDLAAHVKWAWTHPGEMEEMGRAARAEYQAKYTGERNYALLMEIYEQALGNLR